MAVAFGTQATLSGAIRTNSTVTKPASLAVGEYIEIGIEYEDLTAAPTGPAGWTRVDAQNTGGAEKESLFVFYHIADSTDTAAANFTITHASTYTTCWCGRYTGVDGTTPQDATPVTNTGSSTASTASSITTVTDGAMLIHHHVSYDAGLGFTPDAGWTERQDVSDQYVEEKILATAGASGTTVKTWGGAAHSWAAVSVALRPASAADTLMAQICL